MARRLGTTIGLYFGFFFFNLQNTQEINGEITMSMVLKKEKKGERKEKGSESERERDPLDSK
jgi:hypothetical protein